MNLKAARRAPAPKFFLLVLVLSVPFWLLGAVAKGGLPLSVKLPWSALQLVCPLIAALILAYGEDKLEGIKKVFAGVLDFKRIKPVAWYAPILLSMPALFLGTCGIMRLIGRFLPSPRVSWMSVPVLFALYFVAAIFEEAGWMGYAAPRLARRMSALSNGVILGAVWGAWHAVPGIQQGHPAAWILWKCLEAVALRTLIVWLWNNTGRGLLPAVLVHALYNVSWSLFPDSGSLYDPAVGGSILAVAAAIVTVLWGPKTLARFRWSHSGG